MDASPYRVFFDTSVIIAALLSPDGGAGALVRLAEAGVITMIVSEQVIVEADRVLGAKFPELIQESRAFWTCLAPEIAATPTRKQVQPFAKVLPAGDAAILCAASLAQPVAFVTWNTRDFMKTGVAPLVDFPIVVPANCLTLFRRWVDSL